MKGLGNSKQNEVRRVNSHSHMPYNCLRRKGCHVMSGFDFQYRPTVRHKLIKKRPLVSLIFNTHTVRHKEDGL